ncbi:jg12902, partial [Pararge aegeria aegeria]
FIDSFNKESTGIPGNTKKDDRKLVKDIDFKGGHLEIGNKPERGNKKRKNAKKTIGVSRNKGDENTDPRVY